MPAAHPASERPRVPFVHPGRVVYLLVLVLNQGVVWAGAALVERAWGRDHGRTWPAACSTGQSPSRSSAGRLLSLRLAPAVTRRRGKCQ
jgi:hypothetical protein